MSETFTRYGSNITNVWQEISMPMTLCFPHEVVHEKLWKSVNICKSYSKIISGTFFLDMVYVNVIEKPQKRQTLERIPNPHWRFTTANYKKQWHYQQSQQHISQTVLLKLQETTTLSTVTTTHQPNSSTKTTINNDIINSSHNTSAKQFY